MSISCCATSTTRPRSVLMRTIAVTTRRVYRGRLRPVRHRAPLEHRPELRRRRREELAGAPVDDHPVVADEVERVELARAVPAGHVLGVLAQPAAPLRALLVAEGGGRRE